MINLSSILRDRKASRSLLDELITMVLTGVLEENKAIAEKFINCWGQCSPVGVLEMEGILNREWMRLIECFIRHRWDQMEISNSSV